MTRTLWPGIFAGMLTARLFFLEHPTPWDMAMQAVWVGAAVILGRTLLGLVETAGEK